MQDIRVEKLAPELQQLYAAASAARKNSYSPYSGFAVGAAVRTAAGAVYCGCNIENASYGLTCCAERNAVFAAVGAGERELDVLCVAAGTAAPVAPCGACRQVLQEFHIRQLLLANMQGDIKICTLEELLPYSFALQPQR